MAKRIGLFILVNIMVLTTVTIVMSLLGVQPYLTEYGIDYGSLMAFCAIWGMAGAFISLGLSRIMAKWMMGVKLVDPNTADPRAGELVRTVHRLAQSANLPAMPEVGIYNSPEVNAFATGPTKSRSLVAVSSGLLQRMNRDEIEGVLGHEIAHIANGDMVTMTLVQGVINAFVMFFARIAAFAVSQMVRPEMRFMVHIACVIAFQILFSILGYFVVAAFSRWREYRADQGGALLAGQGKMISALKALQNGPEVHDDRQSAVAALKISGKRKGLAAYASTHPPLAERIRRLEMGSNMPSGI